MQHVLAAAIDLEADRSAGMTGNDLADIGDGRNAREFHFLDYVAGADLARRIAGRVDIGDQHALGIGIDAVSAARRRIERGQRHAEDFIGIALGGIDHAAGGTAARRRIFIALALKFADRDVQRHAAIAADDLNLDLAADLAFRDHARESAALLNTLAVEAQEAATRALQAQRALSRPGMTPESGDKTRSERSGDKNENPKRKKGAPKDLVSDVVESESRTLADDYLASACSFCLALLFLTSIFYKLSTLTELKAGVELPVNDCADNPIAAQYQLGQDMGVSGTPAIVTSSGLMVPGYRPADDLVALLGLD